MKMRTSASVFGSYQLCLLVFEHLHLGFCIFCIICCIFVFPVISGALNSLRLSVKMRTLVFAYF